MAHSLLSATGDGGQLLNPVSAPLDSIVGSKALVQPFSEVLSTGSRSRGTTFMLKEGQKDAPA